jgi:molecular chaperone Hsp33
MTDNFVQSFELESSRLRGRIVRLGSVLDDILSAHKTYPEDVLQLTGETLTLCVMLSSMLKYDGIFTLQAQGDGPVPMLVADVATGGKIRACASFSTERLAAEPHTGNPAALLGKGYMAFTVDQGDNTDRYQGIVELKPGSLIASVQHYFTQSEQISTGMVMKAARVNGQWRAGGIMVQQMPEDSESYNKGESNVHEDDWRRTMVLLGSVRDEELVDPSLGAEDLLYRLFHEEGVRVYEAQELEKTCRCSPERVANILSTMSDRDIDDMIVDGKIVMTCEFCSRDYTFDPVDFKKGETRP